MVAVLKLDREKLQKACDKAADLGVVQIANYNCPGQLVTAVRRPLWSRLPFMPRTGARRACP